jgi:hypothetical protein
MTEILIRNIAAPKAHIVLGIVFEEKKEGTNREIDGEEKDFGVRFSGVWISDIPSPLLS